MHVNYSYILLFFFGTLFYPKVLIAQEIQGPTDDLGDVSDAFQENFFEALKQKGIENYELALEALKKAEEAAKEDPDAKAVVFFEMAKNLSKLKRYEEAEANFNKVLQARGDQLDVLEALYDLYYQQKNYEAAIPLVIKLTGILVESHNWRGILMQILKRKRTISISFIYIVKREIIKKHLKLPRNFLKIILRPNWSTWLCINFI